MVELEVGPWIGCWTSGTDAPCQMERGGTSHDMLDSGNRSVWGWIAARGTGSMGDADTAVGIDALAAIAKAEGSVRDGRAGPLHTTRWCV